MNISEEVIIYNNRECKVMDLLDDLQIPHKYYYMNRSSGEPPSLAFYYAKDLVERRNRVQNVVENELSNFDGKKYETLHAFCTDNGLDGNFIYEKIGDGESLSTAVELSFNQRPKTIKHNWNGIYLRYLFLKYKLDEDSTFKYFKLCEGDLFKAIEMQVFLQTMKVTTNGFKKYWNIYYKCILNRVENIENYNLDDEVLNKFSTAYYKAGLIAKELNYFIFLDEMRSKYEIDALGIDDRVRLALSEDSGYCLGELYYIFDYDNGLMSDFEKMKISKKDVWVFKGNRQILERLRKKED